MITAGDSIRQGHSNDRHYFVFKVENIEHNLPMKDVLQKIKDEVLPLVEEGYKYDKLDWSNRHKAWLVQVSKHMWVDMIREDSIKPSNQG